MSNATFDSLWIDTQDTINDILQNEIPPTTDDVTAAAEIVIYQNLCTLYVKYIQVLRKLDMCYDQIVHPQKRRLIRTALDASMGRLLEIYNDMVGLKDTEFHFFDDILTDLKLSADDLEITIPKYFLFERTIELQERERNFDEIIERMGSMYAADQEALEEEAESAANATWEMTVLIQAHERGRQARLKVKTILDVMERQSRQRKRMSTRITQETINKAVVIIQKIWRGYRARKLFKVLCEEEMIFLGMKSPDNAERRNQTYQAVQLVEAHRRAIQERYDYEFEDAVVRIRDQIIDLETGEMKEEMQDKIRNWFHEIMNALGEFPDYPTVEDGGSTLILEDKLPPEEILKRAAELAARLEEEALAEEVVEPLDVEVPPTYIVHESQFVHEIYDESAQYETLWRGKDESDNPLQRHDEAMIIAEKRSEIREEVRQVVDQTMQAELEKLKNALAKDRNIKRPKTKPPKKKREKPKPMKKERDLTPDRTFDSLYEELVMNGIIVKFPKLSMSDYLGDYNYLGSYMQQNAAFEIAPSLADIRRLVTQYCILPLCCPAINERITPLITSVLLVGSHGSGKKMLAHIVASEAGVTLFNLSAENLADKYPGKDGVRMLLHLVKKIGTLMQPAVILVENAHRMFWKRVPKELKPLDPRRLKASMPKFLTTLSPENRILLIGTTAEPSSANVAMAKMYKKILMIPKPDFASRCIFWRQFIKNRMGHELEKVDIALLSKVSDGYTAGSILKACNNTLTDYRKALHKNKPVDTTEFLTALSSIHPVFKDEEDSSRAWYYNNTQLGYDYITQMHEEGLI